jgi:endonuclease/exonuclease/phosphatase family metal-dependent hydrolase
VPAVRHEPERPAHVTKLVIVTWNVHVGGGDIAKLLTDLRNEPEYSGPDVGFVLLLQEAFRASSSIPAIASGAGVPNSIRPRRPAPDIVAAAATLGLSAVYVPSMRNGPQDRPDEREDRGNAILSTEPLSDIEALELPFGKQRRVAVGATVAQRGSPRRVRVVSIHFDTSADRAVQARALAERLREERRGAAPVLAAGDLNSLSGTNDGAYHELNAALPVESCGSEKTNVWPWRLDVLFGWWRGRIDFMFSSFDAAGLSRACETWPDRTGSDHHPVVLVLPLS